MAMPQLRGIAVKRKSVRGLYDQHDKRVRLDFSILPRA
jgi:hypothetical protein